MASYAITRLAMTVPIIIGVSILVFLLLHLSPADPIIVLLGSENYDPATAEALRREYRLDEPLPRQYMTWAVMALQGDLGRSLRSRQPVQQLVGQTFPVTLQLAVLAFLLAIALGLIMGFVSARYQNSWADHLVSSLIVAGLAIPNYLLAVVLVYFLSLKAGIFPPAGYVSITSDPLGALHTMLLPAFCLSLRSAAVIGRMLRSSLLEVLSADFIRTAKSKGLPSGTVLAKHALRNALIPVMTVATIQAGTLIGGTIIIETIFAWPGIGKLVADAIFRRDFPIVQGSVLVTSVAIVLLNAAVDILYSWVDPRIRYE